MSNHMPPSLKTRLDQTLTHSALVLAMAATCLFMPAYAFAETTTVATGLQSPWAMAFLPNNDILVTERAGSLRIVRNGQLLESSVKGVPAVYHAGQGGLLDIMLDQNFTSNRKVYLSFSQGKSSSNSPTLIAATLEKQGDTYQLAEINTLFTATPTRSTAHHHGARIAQMDDSSLLMTVGDGFNYREQAQTLDNHFGKIIRIQQDGSAPADNPFTQTEGALPEIWSLGHRNQQALLVSNGVVYEHEHGPQGGDEVNIIIPGTNYGWPIATYGIDYTGARISPFETYEGLESPLIDWTPSIAPSGMTMHKGDLYVTALAEKSIRKLTINGAKITDQGKVFSQLDERFRDIVSAPDGHLYVLTDGDDARILKLTGSE